MTVPADRLITEVSGTEALWLLEGSAQGLVVYVQREVAVIRPAVHVLQYGCLIIRTPIQATTLSGRALLTYHAEEIHTRSEAGWGVTATGPAEVINDPDETAHYRRTLPGFIHGPHDTLLRIRPQTMTGFRVQAGQAR